ncbi:MBL fold metallo-hydrolase [Novosphingobium malaysiense]|uniref:Uncharacterized protein n=1 Tax=Novosphingobium malaysiense TaxID=1348853 RepID=A0A0B1ZPW7_9SPHN|nr:hypothetical protein [Novosphingobium malaysiense]KHK92601.1 hypothetical protein LK12_07480 [Novosphingobium malaysiense]
MRPTLHPRLVNGRYGDPAVYVAALHRSQSLLFDLGDLAALPSRDLLRVAHVFVSHMHLDHFIGFDRLLRVNVGREKTIEIVGPAGIAEAVGHRLQSYTWDLVDGFSVDLVFEVYEIHSPGQLDAARFRLKAGFAREEGPKPPSWSGGMEIGWQDFRLRMTRLEHHHGVSLGFAVQEPLHVNIWRNRLDARGLKPGPWLQVLKRALYEGAGDGAPMPLPDGSEASLGSLRDLASIEPGQKVVYVTDISDTAENREAVIALADHADILFIDASFAAADAALARQRGHLTTAAAGEIGRAARVKRIEPFHFSPRYETDEQRLLDEVYSAFEAA